MPYVEVHVDASDVLEELSDKEVLAELNRRSAKNAPAACREVYDHELLEQTYYYFRDHRGAPDCLREYIYRVLGRTL